MLFDIFQIKKIIKETAVVNNNKESIIESRITKLSFNLKSVSTLQTHEIANHKLQK